MLKVFIAKRYELKTIGALIEGKSDNERSKIKAQELAKINPGTFSATLVDGIAYVIQITNPPTYDELRGLLCVSVRAWKNGVEVWVDNPLEYKNPPILVPDGTFHKFTDAEGKEQEKANYVEDGAEALKQIILDTVRIITK